LETRKRTDEPEPRGPDPLWTVARTEIRQFPWRFRQAVGRNPLDPGEKPATREPNPTDPGEPMRPEPPGGPILPVRRPDAYFRRAKATFRLINEARSPDPKTRPGDPSDPRGRPGSSCAFPATFLAESVAFSGGFATKNPWGNF
jgi:hypothetical protein